MGNKELETKNESRMLNARYGMYAGQMRLFTHRNPKRGYLYRKENSRGMGSIREREICLILR